MNNRIFSTLLETLQEEYGNVTQKQLGKALGVTQATISNWQLGGMPNERNLKAMIEYFRDHHARTLIKPILEFYEIHPTKTGNEWKFSDDITITSNLRSKLQGKKGIYLYYSSTGEALYLGKTETSLYSEAKQRLKAQPNRPIHTPTRSISLQMGAMTKYLSAYEVTLTTAVKNIESFMLRAFANELRNKNGGHFNLAMTKKTSQ